MKNLKKILIILAVVTISFSGAVKVQALSADRQEEMDNAAAARAAAAGAAAGAKSGAAFGAASANPQKNTTNTNSMSSPKPLLTPPLGNGTAGGTDLKTIFMNVLDVAQTIIIMITTLYLIFAGFMFVTAKGDPGKLKKARDALLWGLIGAGLVLCAEVLAYGIGDTVKEVFKGQ